MDVETEVQNEKKMDPEAFSKTPDGTTATISRTQKTKLLSNESRFINETRSFNDSSNS